MTVNRTLEENIQRLEGAQRRVREVVREGNEMIQAARETLKELREEHDRWADGIKHEVDEALKRQLDATMSQALEDLTKGQHKLYGKMQAEFEKLRNIMIYGNDQGRGSHIVHDWIRKIVSEEVIRFHRETSL